MITWRKPTFGPLSKSSKTQFWSTFISSNWIKSGFSNKISHVIINVDEKLGWIKSESACIWFTWLTSFTYFTGSKFGCSRILPATQGPDVIIIYLTSLNAPGMLVHSGTVIATSLPLNYQLVNYHSNYHSNNQFTVNWLNYHY